MHTSIPFAFRITYRSVESPFITDWKSCLSNPDRVRNTWGSRSQAAKNAITINPHAKVFVDFIIGASFMLNHKGININWNPWFSAYRGSYPPSVQTNMSESQMA